MAEKEIDIPPRKKVGPFNVDTMLPGQRRRAEAENKRIRSRNVAEAMNKRKPGSELPRRDTGDRPVVTKKNRGQQPERRKPRSLPRNVAKEMDPKGPPKGTKSLLRKNKPAIDKPKVDMKPTKPKVDAKTTPKAKSTPVTKRPKVTGKGSRNVTREGPMGKRTLANVTREQLKAAGLTTGPKGLRTYLNMFDKLGRRPKPADFKKGRRSGQGGDATRPSALERLRARMPGGRRKGPARKVNERSKFAGGGMKSKMGTKGGAMGGKKKMAPGMMGGGMKSKMSTKGGAMGGKKKMAPGMKAGGLKMVEKDGKMVPFYAADGVGKMKAGGMKKTKGAAAGGGYKKGGMKSKMASKGGAKGGKKRVSKPKVRGAGIARKGVRPVKYR